MAGYKENLRRLALNDERFVESVLGIGRGTLEVSRLDQKTHALVRLGRAGDRRRAQLLSGERRDGAGRRRQHRRDRRDADRGGAHRRPRARVSAAPELALALGYDVDAALETPPTGGE